MARKAKKIYNLCIASVVAMGMGFGLVAEVFAEQLDTRRDREQMSERRYISM